MFDYVIYKAPCQNCGWSVTGFQTKDADNVLAELTIEELFEYNPSARFYSSCDNCKFWNEYTFEPPRAMKVIPLGGSQEWLS